MKAKLFTDKRKNRAVGRPGSQDAARSYFIKTAAIGIADPGKRCQRPN